MKMRERFSKNEEQEEEQKEEFSIEKVEGFPDWIKLRSDGKYIIVDRTKKEWVFEDIPNKRITSVKKRLQRGRQDGRLDEDKFQLGLISEALVEPIMGELDLDELPGSVMTRLKAGVMKIFDLDAFL